MTWKATMKEPLVPVGEGEYDAMVSNISFMKGPHGQMVRFEFVLAGDDESDGRQVSGVASKRLSANTKLGRWVSAILGRVPEVGEEIAGGDLLHRDCRVVIKHRTNGDSAVFANVAEVLPAQTAARGARARATG